MLVNDLTWVGEAGKEFAKEVHAALTCEPPIKIMLMQELDPDRQGAEFKKMFQAGITPGYLIDKNPHNIYSAIAAPFHPGGHREVSYTMALKSMGGVEDKSKKARQAKAKEVARQLSMDRKKFEEAFERTRSIEQEQTTARRKSMDATPRGKRLSVSLKGKSKAEPKKSAEELGV